MFPIFLEFIYGFFLSFQDLPRVGLGGFELRISFLTVPFFGLLFLFHRSAWSFLKNKKFRPIFAALVVLTGVVIFNVFWVAPTGRSLGFLLWFLINVFVLIYVFWKEDEKVTTGFLWGMGLATAHILVQRVNPFFGVSTEKILAGVDGGSHFRVFSLFGEASYASLYLLVFLAYLSLHPRKSVHYWTFPVLLALSFTYSGVALVGVASFYLIRVFLLLYRKQSLKSTLLQVSVAGVLFLGSYQIWPHLYSPEALPQVSVTQTEKKAIYDLEIKTDQSQSRGMHHRWVSVLRGLEVFQNEPFFGVGLGNSHEYIKVRKPRPELNSVFEGLSNFFLEILVEIGLVGILAFCAFLASIYWVFRKNESWLLFWFIVFVPMQFCQNINMPAFWFALMLSLSLWRKRDLSHHHHLQ